MDWGETLRMNVQFVLRVETPIKLQIISNDNEKLVLDEDEPEVHFMQMEAVSAEYTMSAAVIRQMWR